MFKSILNTEFLAATGENENSISLSGLTSKNLSMKHLTDFIKCAIDAVAILALYITVRILLDQL